MSAPRRARAAWLACAALSVLSGCGEEAEPAAPAPPATTDVVDAALERLSADCGPLERAGGVEPPQAAAVEAVAGDVRELCAVLADDPSMAEFARADIVAFGAAGEAAAAALLSDADAQAAARIGAAAALAAFDSEYGAERLLGLLEDPRAPTFLRAHAAFALEAGAQDWCVPRLVRHLRYETDREAWIFTARALARFRVFAGLEGLLAIRSDANEDPRWREQADGLLWTLASEHQFETPELLAWHWDNGNVDGRIPPASTSPRQQLEIWRFVRDLGDFQLRPVDDARYVLSRLGTSAAHALADALSDDSAHIRLHAAQTLARMGPRARDAGSALVAALDDPVAGVEAAHALGRIGVPTAEPALAARLGAEHDLALRVAAANALGWIGLPSSAALFPELAFGDEPIDLRVAAAAGLARTAPPRDALPALELLLAALEDRRIDPDRPEAELGAWLERTARGDSTLAAEAQALLVRWNELDHSAAAGPQDRAAETARRAARRALLADALDARPLE